MTRGSTVSFMKWRDRSAALIFARVILTYHEAYENGDDEKMSLAFAISGASSPQRPRRRRHCGWAASLTTGIGSIISSSLRCLSRAVGYKGLAVFIDECVNLYKIPNRVSRENNYEKLLSMFNDSLQGRSPGLFLLLGERRSFWRIPAEDCSATKPCVPALRTGNTFRESIKTSFPP